MVSRLLVDEKRTGHLDLEASEMAIRGSMHQAGGLLLEKLLNREGGQGGRHDCSRGHPADLISYRTKDLVTVLAPLRLRRAYYHCSVCKSGVIPRDQDLDIVDTSFSPGARRLMGRVGAKESFGAGGKDLEELAGIFVKTKEVERISELLGEEIESVSRGEREGALSGNVIPLTPSVPKMYIALDGTGVPMVPEETKGRKGKGEDGQSGTREAKLGCVFTQTKVDEKKRPVRDEASTSYVGAIETAEEFGKRLYGEAIRRGMTRAGLVIILGDGAVWIWNLADEHFPGAIQIVDLYHALEHLSGVGKAVYGQGTKESASWITRVSKQLKKGKIETVISEIKELNPKDEKGREVRDQTINYFQTNIERMRYGRFRRQGLFVGSGVIEAGCKTIVGYRLKQSGMHWTVRGANAIIALRCCQMSGRWEEFWENRAAA